jgi:hypothetical protein
MTKQEQESLAGSWMRAAAVPYGGRPRERRRGEEQTRTYRTKQFNYVEYMMEIRFPLSFGRRTTTSEEQSNKRR